MSKLGINIGNNPNDGQGDPLRVAMDKINDNFTEIYNTLGDGNNVISYASTAGISTVARNLTGNPIINVSGILNSGITTTEHLEVRNIKSTGIITAVQFSGDGSQLTNVTSTAAGISIYDDGVLLGVAREIDFDVNLVSTSPDGTQRVRVSSQASYATTAGIATYATTAGYVSVAGYASTAGISTVAQGLTGTPNLNVGVVTATSFVGDGSQLTGISGGGGGIGTDGSVNTTGIITASAFVGDGSGLTNITANSTWSNINLPGNYGATLGIHTTKNVGIGTTADDRYALTVNGRRTGVGGSSYGIRVESGTFSLIENVSFNYGKITVPSFINLVGGELNGWNKYPLQIEEVANPCLLVQSHARFRTTAQFGTSFYEYGSTGPILYPGVMIDGGKSTISVGFGISLNGQSGVITATAFVGDGSGLTGVSTFSGNYNDLTNKPTIPVNITDLSDVNAGSPSTGQVLKWSGTEWQAAADLTTAGAGIGLSDLSVTIQPAGINSLTYNNVTGVFQFTPADLSSYLTNVNISAGANIDVVETSEGNFIITATGGSVGSAGTWAVNASGIHTTKNVGINTTLSSSALWVEGDGYFSGVVTATRFESTSAGTPTIDSPNNLNINAVTVAISTDLTVGGDAYVGVDTSRGLILSSPNGTQYRLIVDNSGNLSTVLVP